MTAILTGDIINSRRNDKWLIPLKEQLNNWGPTPAVWEIFRGDSFQLEVGPELCILSAIQLKAVVKQFSDLDVRIAIGLGTRISTSEKITESNGTAFVNSGTCFDNLKKNTLAIKSTDNGFDEDINLLLELALLTMDNWAPITAEVVKEYLENPSLNQSQLGKLTGRSQSNVSAALNRAGLKSILKMDAAFRKRLKSL
ncbi:MAG: transcriptional regulator [Leeuwenhoekiella sp.]